MLKKAMPLALHLGLRGLGMDGFREEGRFLVIFMDAFCKAIVATSRVSARVALHPGDPGAVESATHVMTLPLT